MTAVLEQLAFNLNLGDEPPAQPTLTECTRIYWAPWQVVRLLLRARTNSTSHDDELIRQAKGLHLGHVSGAELDYRSGNRGVTFGRSWRGLAGFDPANPSSRLVPWRTLAEHVRAVQPDEAACQRLIAACLAHKAANRRREEQTAAAPWQFALRTPEQNAAIEAEVASENAAYREVRGAAVAFWGAAS